jgi:hypothetical protein
MKTLLKAVFLTLMIAMPATAHESGIGPNGGMWVDAAPFRVELVPAGTAVNVYITMEDDSAIDTSTMKGTAILLVDGKPLRVILAPKEPGVLSAETGVTVPKDVKGAVQITGPDGKTSQAKF